MPGETRNSEISVNGVLVVLLTSVDDRLRNGEEALRLATQIVSETGDEQPSCLGTLAAAHAELGRFDEAANQSKTAGHFESQLRSRERAKPIRGVPNLSP